LDKTIIVKSLYNNDIRRFPVSNNCTWSNFIGILSKLYDTDISTMRLTYRDEEGDDIAVTTDDELLEAFRLAQESIPPLLRLLVSSNLTVSVHSQNLLNSIITNSVQSSSIKSPPPPRPVEATPPSPPKPEEKPKEKPHIPKPEEKPKEKPHIPDLTPKTEKSVFSSDKKKEGSDTPIPVVYISGKPYMPKSLPGDSQKPYNGPTKVHPSSHKIIPEKGTIVNLTSRLAESTTSLVLESSDSTLFSSTVLSDTITEQSQKLYDKTVDSNILVAQAISEQATYLCKKYVAGELDDKIRQTLTNACYETGQNSVKLSDQIAAMSIENSNQISEDLQPVSSQTRHLQDVATFGLEENLSKEVDAVVQNIMSATKPTPYE